MFKRNAENTTTHAVPPGRAGGIGRARDTSRDTRETSRHTALRGAFKSLATSIRRNVKRLSHLHYAGGMLFVHTVSI